MMKCSIMKMLVAGLLLLHVADVSAADGLSKTESDRVREQVVNEWMEQTRATYGPMFLSDRMEDLCVSNGEGRMPIWYKIYGNAPMGDRSLWISLHGGGGTTQQINDEQWDNQKRLYQPQEGVYVAPRAPVDAWDMWFQTPIDVLYEKLIQAMVACHGVNPDKVYLMGYSAGGDGVWRLAPRMADHWAAASMMAGHPGDVSLLNLRNLPFMIWCGELDAAYNRNKVCAERGEEMDSLQRDCPEGYIHQTHIVPGKGHWMNHKDSAALPWMQKFVRNPYPRSIVWQQEEVTKSSFYWLQIPENEMQRGRQVRLSVEGNTINIVRCDYSQLTLYLCDELMDLDKSVTVNLNGRRVFKGKVLRREDVMRRTMTERGDPRYCFPAMLEIETSSQEGR